MHLATFDVHTTAQQLQRKTEGHCQKSESWIIRWTAAEPCTAKSINTSSKPTQPQFQTTSVVGLGGGGGGGG